MSDEEFAERVTAMTQTLYRVCYAQLSQACDREDAVQEALRKCWQKRGQLRDARYLQTWVIRVLLNECHNIQRRAARLQHRADGCADLRRHILRRRVGEGDGDLCAELQRLVQQADLDVGPADINADLIHVRLLFSLILRLHHAA